MKPKLMLCLLIIAVTFRCAEVDERVITFVVAVPDSLVTNDTLYIAGNVLQLGNWQPDAVPMNPVDKNTWRLTVKLPVDSYIEYKFTRGSWHKEEVLADGTIPGNKHLKVTKNQTVTHQVENWVDRVYKPIGGVTGTVRYHPGFYANKLKNERTIVVWLPDGYDQKVHQRYPVLYMHDGQNIFDPQTSYLGVDWQIDETADSLIKQGKIKEIIIVGMYNTPDRIEEYADTEKGQAYMEFIINDLKPFIDREYRTLPDRKNTAVMGSSMGGLISFYLVWRYPEIFGQAACLSSSFVWNNGAILKEVKNFAGTKKNIRIYFDNGGVGLEGKYTPYYHRMKNLLVARGFQVGKDLEYFFDEHADHSERAWAKRAWRALIFLFG